MTLPEYLEAVFVSPDATRMGVYRNGDSVQSDWTILQVRMRKEITHPKMIVPWGELIIATAGCGLVYQTFSLQGLLWTGIIVWISQRITTNVKREIETRRRLHKHEPDSSPSAPTS